MNSYRPFAVAIKTRSLSLWKQYLRSGFAASEMRHSGYWLLFYIDSLKIDFFSLLLLLFLFLLLLLCRRLLLLPLLFYNFFSVSLLLREMKPIPGNPVMVRLRDSVTVPIELRPPLVVVVVVIVVVVVVVMVVVVMVVLFLLLVLS